MKKINAKTKKQQGSFDPTKVSLAVASLGVLVLLSFAMITVIATL